MADARRRSARGARGGGLGRRLVPPRLLRRRHAARLGGETTNAASTRSRSRGPSSPAPPDPARAARAMAAVEEHLVRARRRAHPALHAALRPDRRSTPATSRATCPGVRENGGQYTHAAAWIVIAFALLGDGDRAAELFAILNPINHAATRAARPPLQGRALRRRGRRLLRAARTPAAAAGPGTPARSGGCTARRSSGSSACRRRGDSLHRRSVHPARLAALRGRPAPRSGHATRSRSRTRAA